MDPLVTVIIPNYNHGKFLRERIESVFNQSYNNIEVIILDDKSVDNSREIIEEVSDDHRIKEVLYSHKNTGNPFRQWKKGIEKATGDFIWIAESDDVSDTTFLSEGIESLLKSKLGVYFCNSRHIDEKGEILEKIEKPYEIYGTRGVLGRRFLLNKYFTRMSPIKNTSAAIVKKGVISPQILNSIRRFRFAGDKFFFVLLSEKTQFYHSINYCNYIRDHSMTTRAGRKMGMEIRRFLENIYITFYLLRRGYISVKDFVISVRHYRKTIFQSKSAIL